MNETGKQRDDTVLLFLQKYQKIKEINNNNNK
jgi:hypothetical protein